ncbi:venom serine protease isoform X1 [Pieris rapae]|uniref:venom serine protease isoform X1 n=1 Tax=Pieris rapae TaxID=64459 RepID=UPI001E2812E5|nr:venom serine protease isoform X1 [Pieris rapae]
MWGLSNYRWILCVVAFLIAYVRAQDANCDFSQKVVPGRTYYVYNPGYPRNYRPGVQCRTIATCPRGYNCRINCQVNIPETSGCYMDRLLVSRTGDPTLASADPYCGRGQFSAVSVAQTLSIGLISSIYSRGGTYYCTLVAQAATPDPSPVCSCGARKSTRIVGGQDALPNEFPSMVALVERGSSNVMCGGVIISNRYVLTAAHCITNKNPSNLAVVVGEHDISTGTDTPGTKAYLVSNIRIHPQFSDVNYDYDIAIITVAQNIQFNEYASPVCLPFKFANYDFAGQKLTITGWGTLFIGGPTPNVLQKVDVDVIQQDVCKWAVPSLTSRQICTYTPGKDACQFDSGGPLLYTDPQTGLLFHAGIVSSGRLCASANEPGVNTRVTELLNWIVQNAPADYCRK